VAHDTDGAIAALELSDAELARVAARAQERTLEEHTADRRAAELERAVAAAASAIPPAAQAGADIARAG
jgi:hypothetical protein